MCYKKRQRVIAQHRVCDRDRGSQCSIMCDRGSQCSVVCDRKRETGDSAASCVLQKETEGHSAASCV